MCSKTPRDIERWRNYPKVLVQLRELYAHEQMPLLLEGTLDISFIRDGLSTPGLQMTALLREPFVAVLPEGHPIANHSIIAPKMLKDERFVLFSPKIAKLAYKRTIGLCEADGFIPDIRKLLSG
jgi:DNA-binding transcriptional LysR family regulator